MIVLDWFDQTGADPSTPAPVGWRVAILIGVVYQSFMVARLLFAGQPAEGAAYSMTRSLAGGLLMTVLTVGAAAALAACPRWPNTTSAVLALLFVASASHGMHNYVAIPFLLSIYWAASREPVRTAAAATLTAIAAMTLASMLAAPRGVVAELLGQWSTLAMTLIVAMAARALSGWRRATDRAAAEHERLVGVTRERDEARARTRIAGELHDSVGHDLTAIIALSEGLLGTLGDPDTDEAMTGINTLARRGLDETRRAVTSLANPLLHDEPATHHWDQIEPLTHNVRALGIPVILTETGARPTDPAAANLAFTVAREAVTNAVRHSPDGLAHLAIAIDHRPEATTLAIRSQGHRPLTGPAPRSGSGITRLHRLVTTSAGRFTAGPDHDAWLIQATIPHNQEHP